MLGYILNMTFNTFRTYIYHILRKTERYTKTDMVYVARNGFWLGIGQVFGSLSSLVTSILFANFVSKETFGIYKYILSTAGLAGSFSLTGMSTVITRAAAQGHKDILRGSLGTQFTWAIPQLISLLCFAAYYYIQGNSGYALAFLFAAVCLPIVSVTKSFTSYLYGIQDFVTATMFSVQGTLISFCLLAPVILLHSNYTLLVVAYYAIAATTSTYYCFKTLRRHPTTNEAVLRSSDLSYAKHLSIMNLASSVAQQIDAILVYHLLGPAQLAIFTFATIIPDRVRLMFGSLSLLLLPKLASNTVEKSSMVRKFVQLTVIAVILIGILVLVTPILYHFVFPAYVESVFYAQLYALVLIALPTQLSISSLYVSGNKRPLYVLNVGLPIFKILLSIVGIVFFSILGAVLARVVYFIVYTVVSQQYTMKAQP